jgi:hypothetical protein
MAAHSLGDFHSCSNMRTGEPKLGLEFAHNARARASIADPICALMCMDLSFGDAHSNRSYPEQVATSVTTAMKLPRRECV